VDLETTVKARIDADTKRKATEALNAIGYSVSDAIRILMLRIANDKRLPFDVYGQEEHSIRQ